MQREDVNCTNCRHYEETANFDGDGHLLSDGCVCKKSRHGLKGFPYRTKIKCYEMPVCEDFKNIV